MNEAEEKIVQLLTEIRDAQRDDAATRRRLLRRMMPVLLTILALCGVTLAIFSAAMISALLSTTLVKP